MNREDRENIEQELLKQQYYIDKLRQENEQHFALTGERKKYLTETWGCQVNSLRCISRAH